MEPPISDQLAIQSLYSKYAHYIDGGDSDAWAGLFTSDGTFRREKASGTLKDFPVMEISGTENLRQFAREVYAREKGMARHWTSNLVVEGDHERASVHCYAMLIDLRDGAPRIVVTANFRDELVRTSSGWRFHSRTGRVSP